MSEYPHYNVWLSYDGTFLLPEECYAAVLFDGSDGDSRYRVFTCEMGSRSTAIFRHLQHLRHLNKVRSLPTSIVVKVGSLHSMTDYSRNSPPAPEEGWTKKIDWNNVLKALADEARELFPIHQQE